MPHTVSRVLVGWIERDKVFQNEMISSSISQDETILYVMHWYGDSQPSLCPHGVASHGCEFGTVTVVLAHGNRPI